jgi:menaquinone-dependent protoporphyrinogen oxidase
VVPEVLVQKELLLFRLIALLAQGERMTRVLVAFASKMGGTQGIAEAIGEELLDRGLDVEVHAVAGMSSVDGYGAVVLGSAIYAARWRPEAARFFRRHTAKLAGRRVWLFESGWIGKRPELLAATPGGRRRATRVGADMPVVFGGRLDPDLATGPLDRLLARRMSGDFRDFTEIRTWARKVADSVPATGKQVKP